MAILPYLNPSRREGWFAGLIHRQWSNSLIRTVPAHAPGGFTSPTQREDFLPGGFWRTSVGVPRMRKFTFLGVATAALVLLAWSWLAAAPMAAHATPLPHPAIWAGSSTSTNWAGYAVTGASKSVTDVKGSWTVPKIQGACPLAGSLYSSFWVGIDGYSSGTVEQTGTDSDCQSGSATYYGWYEFYPKASHTFTSFKVHPGDVMSAEVKFVSGKFTVTLKDTTTGSTSSASSKLSAQRTSAEWIAEAPSSFSGVLPLANFGKVGFGLDNTSISNTCDATVGGTTGHLGSFSSAVAITMVNSAGTKNKATPSAISSDKTSFNVTWVSSGP